MSWPGTRASSTWPPTPTSWTTHMCAPRQNFSRLVSEPPVCLAPSTYLPLITLLHPVDYQPCIIHGPCLAGGWVKHVVMVTVLCLPTVPQVEEHC